MSGLGSGQSGSAKSLISCRGSGPIGYDIPICSLIVRTFYVDFQEAHTFSKLKSFTRTGRREL